MSEPIVQHVNFVGERRPPNSPNGVRTTNTEMPNKLNRRATRDAPKRVLGYIIRDGLPTVSKGFGSILFGKTVVLRCSILGED